MLKGIGGDLTWRSVPEFVWIDKKKRTKTTLIYKSRYLSRDSNKVRLQQKSGLQPI
jgi:hypothetical protein